MPESTAARLRGNLSLVISCLALAVALSGTAYAVGVKPGSVDTKALAKGAVTAKKIQAGAVTGPKIRRSAVGAPAVADGSLGKGGFLQVSGILFTYDRARPSGSRLVGDITRVGGATLGSGDTVQVVMPTYPACQGGDGYAIPEAAESCTQASAGPRAADLLVRYLSDSLGGKIALPQGGRIVPAAASPG